MIKKKRKDFLNFGEYKNYFNKNIMRQFGLFILMNIIIITILFIYNF